MVGATGWRALMGASSITATPASSVRCRVRASSANLRSSGSAGRQAARATGWWVRTAPSTATATPPSSEPRAGCDSPRLSRVSPPPDAASDEVRPAVGVDARPRHVAVAPGDEVGGEGRDLVRQPGPPEIGGLMECLADPLHDVVRVGRVKTLGGEDLSKVLGEAG